jgi:hypothetical protein
MSDFKQLKLDDDLVDFLGRLGFRQPTALQEEAVPVIARGTTAVGIASSGSGKTLAYGLGLAARLDPSAPGTQALVLRPTDAGAGRTADALHRLLQPSGLTVGVIRAESPLKAQVACASPAGALAALEHSAIKLEGLASLVVDGASAMVGLGAADALETLTAQVPKEAQRVVFTSEITKEVEDWIDRHARRARRLTYLPTEITPLEGVNLEFWAAPQHEWLPVLVRLLSEKGAKSEARRRIHCRLEEHARALADQLQVRGIGIAEGPSAPGVRIDWSGQRDDEPADLSVAWGAPPDVPALIACVPRHRPTWSRMSCSSSPCSRSSHRPSSPPQQPLSCASASRQPPRRLYPPGRASISPSAAATTCDPPTSSAPSPAKPTLPATESAASRSGTITLRWKSPLRSPKK